MKSTQHSSWAHHCSGMHDCRVAMNTGASWTHALRHWSHGQCRSSKPDVAVCLWRKVQALGYAPPALIQSSPQTDTLQERIWTVDHGNVPHCSTRQRPHRAGKLPAASGTVRLHGSTRTRTGPPGSCGGLPNFRWYIPDAENLQALLESTKHAFLHFKVHRIASIGSSIWGSNAVDAVST